jgi:anti-sigma B factor antagonist
VLEVRVSDDGGRVVVEVAGEIDLLTAGQLRDGLCEAVRVAGTGLVIVDLGRVDFLDSSGVQVLVDGYHTAMVAGGTLTVRGAGGIPARVLHVVGLAKLLGVAPRDGDTDGPTLHESERPG